MRIWLLALAEILQRSGASTFLGARRGRWDYGTNPFPLPDCQIAQDQDGVLRPVVCITDAWTGLETCAPDSTANFTSMPNCVGPRMHPACNDVRAGFRGEYVANGTKWNHGNSIVVGCSSGSTPIDGKYDISTWGEPEYGGHHNVSLWCSNGTWVNKHINLTALNTTIWPDLRVPGFTCASREQIRLLRMARAVRAWSIERMREADTIYFRWEDSKAVARKFALEQAQNMTLQYYEDAKQGRFASIANLTAVIDVLRNSSIQARGEAVSPTGCANLEYQFQGKQEGITFTCQFQRQKTPLGPDPQTQQEQYFYREGCLCRSWWRGFCPFEPGNTPSLYAFGFDMMESLNISRTIGTTPTALCFYWLNATHPEWGYLPGSVQAETTTPKPPQGLRHRSPCPPGTDGRMSRPPLDTDEAADGEPHVNLASFGIGRI